MSSEQDCPICNGAAVYKSGFAPTALGVDCTVCGRFDIDEALVETSKTSPSIEEHQRWRIACALRNQAGHKGARPFWLTYQSLDELMKDAPFPLDPLQRDERLLVSLGMEEIGRDEGSEALPFGHSLAPGSDYARHWFPSMYSFLLSLQRLQDAMGLGVPVIWCCRKSSLNDMHFDTRQYQHLLWETESELKSLLQTKIEARFPPPSDAVSR